MSTDLASVDPQAPVADAARLMRDKDVGTVLVEHGGELAREQDKRSALADISGAPANH